MSALGNLVWFIFLGWWNSLLYLLFGVLFSITIIGIPIGKALFQYAKLMAFPFGKVIIKETDLKGKENVSAVRQIGGVIANIIWLPFGVFLCITYMFAAVGLAITILGIPFAIVLFRSAIFLIWPVGAKVVSKEEANIARMERSMVKVAGTAMSMNQSMMPAQPVQQSAAQTVTTQTGEQTINVQTGAQPTMTANTPVPRPAGLSAGDTLGELKAKSLQTADSLRVKLRESGTFKDIYAYLEYITLGMWVLVLLLSMLFFGAGNPIRSVLGFLLFWVTVALGVIKENKLFVLILMGGNVLLSLLSFLSGGKNILPSLFAVSVRVAGSHRTGFPGMLFLLLFLLIKVALLVLYVLIFVKDNGSLMAAQTVTAASGVQTAAPAGMSVSYQMPWQNAEQTTAPVPDRCFCPQCGVECPGAARFCPKCGSKIE